MRSCGLEKSCRLYQASTSELYGKVQEIPQKETTPFYPRSPYVERPPPLLPLLRGEAAAGAAAAATATPAAGARHHRRDVYHYPPLTRLPGTAWPSSTHTG